ncbi:hypothetical protein L6164_001677 [Bauhinia variegata]|uniref:Uncharacterized protein n=1 Tax=Bauhinia variegata TaxID=167791 RepID=A0ACB9QA55_BAUVA|nr:hypothetical protein L6164_001677 [Bauhinia variegata]
MVKEWKGVRIRGYEGGSSYGEELGRLVFVLCAAFLSLSLFAAIVFFCAEGASRDPSKAAATDHGPACAAAACGGACGA